MRGNRRQETAAAATASHWHDYISHWRWNAREREHRKCRTTSITELIATSHSEQDAMPKVKDVTQLLCGWLQGSGYSPCHRIHWDQTTVRMSLARYQSPPEWMSTILLSLSPKTIVNINNNKITFKRTWSLSNAVCFKYVKYLTTNTAKVGHVTPSRPPLT